MIIKTMSLQDFKGIKNATYTFYDKTNISAENGTGKSTIVDAYMWLWCNKDSSLNDNPAIFPNDNRECTPTVAIEVEIDGKPVAITKRQKRKQSKTGDNSVAYTNFYEVNSVEVSKANFEKKLAEYGVNFNHFLVLSHADVFLTGIREKKAREQMRDTLFQLANIRSDLEIAKADTKLSELASLLENYSIEEVEAMQNATLRKIRDEYGKKGEILKAKIEGMELSKVDIDVAELELQKNALNEQITDIKARQNDLSKQLEEIDKASNGILELKFQVNDLIRQANEENYKAGADIKNKISEKKFLIDKTDRTIKDTEKDITCIKSKIGDYQGNIEKLRSKYKDVQCLAFDENSLVCSYCGQEYPEEKKDELRAEFESHKAEELKTIEENGKHIKSEIEVEQETLRTLELELAEHKESLEMPNTAIAELENQLAALPQSIDILGRADIVELNKQIAEKEQAMKSANSQAEIRQELSDQLDTLQAELSEVEKKIALSVRNVEIDEQISNLKAKQRDYEQNIADCDRVKYQLDLLSKKKNELATNDINSHFEIVKWQLFDYQKNGEYKNTCIPIIDDYKYGVATNKGREVLAKLDIIKGLQKFYGESYPVFVDNSECLSDKTVSRINMDCQLIMLKVSEDKEIVVSKRGKNETT
jgi:hypothetical protein